MTRRNQPICVAAAQLPATRLSEAPAALGHIEAAARDAAAAEADLLVLPECAYPAYLLGSAERYRQAHCLPTPELLARLGALAADFGMHIVCGIVEERDGRLYNAAALLAPDGLTSGIYRKLFMWGADRRYFEPGDALPVFETGLGRIGIMICADARAPEIPAGLAAQHVDVIAMPTSWINWGLAPGEYRNPQPEFLIPARAREFGVPIVCANKFGMETDSVGYCGRSMIVTANGTVAAEAGAAGTALVSATIDPERTARPKMATWTRDWLFSREPAELPSVGQNGTVRLAVVPARLIDELTPMTLLAALIDCGVEFLVSHSARAGWAEQLTVIGRAYNITVAAAPTAQRVSYENVGSYAWITGEEARSFAPARALALEGAGILFVSDPPGNDAILRTRALENRVYVVTVGPERACVIAPTGDVLACGDDKSGPLIVPLDLNLTADKHVYDGTDIWEQRHPAVYAKAMGAK